MEIIKTTVTGINKFEFLSGWLYASGNPYTVTCDTLNTEYDSLFTFTIKFTEASIKQGHLEMFKRTFENTIEEKEEEE